MTGSSSVPRFAIALALVAHAAAAVETPAPWCDPRPYTALVAGAELHWGEAYDLTTGESYEIIVRDSAGIERHFASVDDLQQCVSFRVVMPLRVGATSLWTQACDAQGTCRTSPHVDFTVMANCDLNDDGTCTAVDFNVFKRMFQGLDPIDPRADANQDGALTGFDFNEWKKSFVAQPVCNGAFGGC